MSSESNPSLSVAEFVARLKTIAEEPQAPPWVAAKDLGSAAVAPVAALLSHGDMEVRRYARRALEVIVRRSSAPGKNQTKAVQAELLKVLQDTSPDTQRPVLWLLSEIGDDEAVPALAALLKNEATREDARCALVRIPGAKSLAALKAASDACSDSFKAALEDAVRKRTA